MAVLHVLLLVAEFLAIAAHDSGNRAIRDSRFCAAKNGPSFGDDTIGAKIIALHNLIVSNYFPRL